MNQMRMMPRGKGPPVKGLPPDVIQAGRQPLVENFFKKIC